MRGFILIASLLVPLSACGQEASQPTYSNGKQRVDVAASGPPERPPPPPPPSVDAPVEGLSTSQLNRLPFNPTGTYQRTDLRGGMRIRSRGGAWEVYLSGDSPDRGDATASPCELVAVGPLEGRRIEAGVVPYKGREYVVYPSSVAGKSANDLVVVEFDGRVAEVQDRGGSFGICGLQADLSGRYVRQPD